MHKHDLYAILFTIFLLVVVMMILRVSPADMWRDFTSKDEHPSDGG